MAAHSAPEHQLTLDIEQVTETLRNHFGLIADHVQPLSSEFAAVHRVTVDGRALCFKAVLSKSVEPKLFRWQGRTQAALASAGLPVSQLHPPLTDNDLTVEFVHGELSVLAQLYEWIDGSPLIDVLPDDGQLLGKIGGVAAKINSALQHVEAAPSDVTHEWDLTRTRHSIEAAMPLIQNADIRAILLSSASRFEREVEPVLGALPRSVVHQDIHDSNILVALDRSDQWEVRGVLDFGDMVNGLRIADLIVPGAYAARHYIDPLAALRDVVSGWRQVAPLSDTEAAVVLPGAIGRLAVNAAIWTSRLDGDRGEYARLRSKGTLDAIAKLLSQGTEEFVAELRLQRRPKNHGL